MSKLDKDYNNLFPWGLYSIPKKLQFTRLYRFYFDLILRLLYRVIIIEGLPDNIEDTFLKLVLYTQGKIIFFNPEELGEVTALNGSGQNTPTLYYMPSKYLVVNPRLKKSYTLTPGKDCEPVYLSETDKYNSDGITGGLYELIRRTATMLADNDISINVAQKNTRLTNIISADTQNTKDSIEAVVGKMIEGDPNIIVKSSLIDRLQSIPFIQNVNNQNLIQLIEVQQYILAHFYELIGLQTHDQMKRERLITAEINDGTELSLFNIDDIINSLRDGFDRVNAMFGTEIKVKLNPLITQQLQPEEMQAQTAEKVIAEINDEPEPDPEEDEAAEDQTEDAAPEEDAAAAEDQTEDAAPEENAAAEDQTEDAAPEEDAAAAEDQTEDAAPEEDAAAEDQTEDAAPDIVITGDNNTIIINEGGEVDAGTDAEQSEDLEPDSGDERPV